MKNYSLSTFPYCRMRRGRRHHFSRRLLAENHLKVNDLIYPVFIMEAHKRQEEVVSMPGIFRVSLDILLKEAEQVAQLGIPVMALFPVIESSLKSLQAEEAYNPKGLVQRAIGLLKKHLPHLGLLTDVALDPYTSHGQDGVIDQQQDVINDLTNQILTRQALSQAEAGADIIAPSDMMDGCIRIIRAELEKRGFFNTQIMAYSAKYASCYYGPFREAVGSSQHLKMSR